MKKIPQKKLNRIKDLEHQECSAYREYMEQVGILEKKYKITSEHYDYNYNSWTDNDKRFDYETSDLHTKYENKQNIIRAKRMARFLIATNIARRGKLLHPDNAIRELQKYGPDGEEIILILETPIMPMVLNSQPYLAHELHKCYGVTLMDKYMYDCVNKYIKEQAWYHGHDRKREKYKWLLKKFHGNIKQR